MSPERLRAVVSTVLISGVMLAAVLIAAGFVGSLFVGWQGSLLGGPPADSRITGFDDLAAGLRVLRPQAVAQIGLLVLVATPVVRVATSLVGFVMERDRLYVAITATVLGVLLASLFVIR